MPITRKENINKTTLNEEMHNIAQRIDLQNIKDHIHYPRYFQLETARICNAKCPFCAIDKWDKSTPLMADSLYDKIIDDMSQYSDWIKAVCIQRAGEPLVDKKISFRIQQLKNIGIKKVNMSTNVSLLTERKARELFEAGLDEIMLSIDTVEKQKYEEMRVGLRYEKVMKNISTLFKVRDEIKPEAVVRVRGVSFYNMELPEHRDELQAWEDYWAQYKKPHDRIYQKLAHNWGNQKQWDDHIEDRGDIFHPCVLLWGTMHITAMGHIALCSMDYDATHFLGDLNKESITEVWRGMKFKNVRKLHEKGNRNEINMCQGCKLFDLDFKLEDWQQLQLYD